MQRIVVTGAGGFIGRVLCPSLAREGWRVVAAVRSAADARSLDGLDGLGGEVRAVGDLAALPDLSGLLAGVDGVVHLAGRAHRRDPGRDAESAYLRANLTVTRHLAGQAAAAGVRRLVFLSSVKVNGEETRGNPFRETDLPAPQDSYGRSKLAAEGALRAVAAATGLETVVIRPPLVYGPGVKANFRSLMAAVARGWPLPLGSVDNRRSLVGLWNLCDLIGRCLTHPAAVGETFLVRDGADLSTPDLIRALGRALNRPARLVRVPPTLLRLAGRTLGAGDRVDRLLGSLQVDASKAARLLGWQPPLGTEEGLARTARDFLGSGSR